MSRCLPPRSAPGCTVYKAVVQVDHRWTRRAALASWRTDGSAAIQPKQTLWEIEIISPWQPHKSIRLSCQAIRSKNMIVYIVLYMIADYWGCQFNGSHTKLSEVEPQLIALPSLLTSTHTIKIRQIKKYGVAYTECYQCNYVQSENDTGKNTYLDSESGYCREYHFNHLQTDNQTVAIHKTDKRTVAIHRQTSE